MLESMTRDSFEQVRGSRFRISCAEGDEGSSVQLELVEVSSSSASRREGFREAFSLLFQGHRDLRLPQQTYRLAHDRLGELELFLVPLEPNREASFYEAVFA